jgi:hypothetical protein
MEHSDSASRLPLGTVHNQCMGGAMYGRGDPDEGQERLRRTHAESSAYGLFAARMTSDRFAGSSFEFPRVTPHGLRVTAHFA